MSTKQKFALMAAHQTLVNQGLLYWARAVLHYLNGDSSETAWAHMALASQNVHHIKLEV